jgi:hypothetical protein
VKIKKKQNTTEEIIKGNIISRKNAMKRLGLTAFSAATMMLLLNNPAKADDSSPELPPDWP